MWLFFLVIFLMNALFFDSADRICSWWIFSLSHGGLVQGANVVLRVMLIIIISNIFTCTTDTAEITFALNSLIKPLKFIRVPVEDVAMIISIAIQFIPTLLEETDTIRKAQTARGARFESKRLLEKAASITPLVIPIFISAFRHADELSQAMEARGYRNARNRTRRKREPLHMRDYAALAVCTSVFVIQISVL